MVLVFLTVQCGCSPQSGFYIDEIPKRRSQLGTIGIVSGQYVPEIVFDLPPGGILGGMGRGMGVGAATGAGIIAQGGGGDLFFIALVAAGGILGGFIGTVYGAFAAEPADEVEEAEQILRKASNDLTGRGIQEIIRKQLLIRAHKKTSYTFREFPRLGPSSPEDVVNYQVLHTNGIDTVLEVQILSWGIREKDYEMNPRLNVFIRAKARLIRTIDDAILFEEEYDMDYDREAFLYTEWEKDGGRLFRQEMQKAFQALADHLVLRLFYPSSQEADPMEPAQTSNLIASGPFPPWKSYFF